MSTRTWRRALAALIAVGAAAALTVQPAHADATVSVTPIDHQGWTIPAPGNPPVTWGFNGPADAAGGADSLQFGPLSATVGAEKFEMQPPETQVDIADFGGLAYDFQVVTPATGRTIAQSAVHFYTNVYVDSAANGLGFFGNGTASSGFYDCRYSFIPSTAGLGWNTYSIAPGDTPSSPVTARHSSCAATIAGTTGEILFLRLNGGDTSTNDKGLVGAYDLVDVTVAGDTTTYDFTVDADGDGIPDTAPPTAKDDCKKGGWASFNNPSFRNQGDCVSYTNHN